MNCFSHIAGSQKKADKLNPIKNIKIMLCKKLGLSFLLANNFKTITKAKITGMKIKAVILWDKINPAKEKDKKKFLYTIEFFPEEGKYHWDGHRACDVGLPPSQTRIKKGICPVCKKDLTIGVLSRVEKLADRPQGFKPDTIGYKSLIPLAEIIADALGQGKLTKKVNAIYQDMIVKGGNEFKILLDLSDAELERITLPEIALGIKNVREGKVKIIPGCDGKYGIIEIFSEDQKIKSKQKSLF